MNISGKGGRPSNKYDDKIFWNNVDIKGRDECWPWKNFTGKSYPTWNGRPIHYTIAELKYGKLTKFNNRGMKMGIRHICNNKSCANPRHIRFGTLRENVKDNFRMDGKKVLTHTQVRELRKLRELGKTYIYLSKLYNISKSTIRNAHIGIGTYGEIV